MEIHFICPNCNTKYKDSLDNGGKRGKCKKCGTIIVVPSSPRGIDYSTPNNLYQNNKGKAPKMTYILFGVAILLIIIIGMVIENSKSSTKITEQRLIPPVGQVKPTNKDIAMALKEISNRMNSQCPANIDEYTVLIETRAVGKKFIYMYQINRLSSIIGEEALEEALKKRTLQAFCTKPEFHSYRENDVTMEYRYRLVSSDGISYISFTIHRGLCSG